MSMELWQVIWRYTCRVLPIILRFPFLLERLASVSFFDPYPAVSISKNQETQPFDGVICSVTKQPASLRNKLRCYGTISNLRSSQEMSVWHEFAGKPVLLRWLICFRHCASPRYYRQLWVLPTHTKVGGVKLTWVRYKDSILKWVWSQIATRLPP